MEDQPLPADASPTALSLGYVDDFDPKKEEKDPKEDLADYPADRGDNDDESSNDDDDDDDVEKDEEDNMRCREGLGKKHINCALVGKTVIRSVSEIDEDNNQPKVRYKVEIMYHVVPPPYTGNYMPPRAELSFARLDDSVFKFKISKTRTSVNENESIASNSSKEIREEHKTVRSSAHIIEDYESNSEDEYKDKTSTEQDKSSNDNSTQKEGIGLEFNKRACFVCGSVNYLIKDCTFYENKMVEKSVVNNKGKGTGQREVRPVWNNARRVNHQNFSKMTHPHPKRNFVPTAVATKSGQVLVNAAKQSSTASTSTARPKINTADQGIFYSRGFRHMTCNKSFLIEYQEINGGSVAFGGSSKGGKITEKGKIRTGKLDFEDVYFVKELKFNLFSVSQMFDKKNSVLFTETNCLVLSPDFKLLDERVLVTKPHNKTPYELLIGRSPNLEFMRPFRCLVTILNTLDHLGKFDGNADEGFLVGYSVNSKAFRVFNSRTRKVEENLHVNILENKPNVTGSRPELFFDVDSLTRSMNYEPVSAGNQSYGDADVNTGDQPGDVNAGDKPGDINACDKPGDVNAGDIQGDVDEISRNDDVSTGIFDGAFDDRDLGVEDDTNNLDSSTVVSPIPTTRVHKDHPKEQIIGYPNLNTQTRRMINFYEETAMALKDPSWIKAMQDDLLQFKLQDVWTLVDLPYGKRAIGSKWVFRNKLDERVARIEAIRLFLAYASFKDFIVYQMDVKSAFLYGKIEKEVYVCQPPRFEDFDFPDKVYKVKKKFYGLHQAPRAWYETMSTYLLNNGFKRGQIDKTLFIKRNKGDILLVQVYVDDIIFGSTKKEMCDAFEILMHEKFQMSSMGELTFFLGLQVKQMQDGIFISQDKYVAEILKKFRFSDVKTASTPMETSKPLLKDEDGQEVDVHIYRSMIGSLMYLTSLRPDIMFVVCACARHQVSTKVSHLHAVKMIFRYLKGQPKLSLWYSKDSPFELEAYVDSDYAGSSLDSKSTTGGCQFLGCRLISWQCKKQTVVTNSTTEAEYVAASKNYALLVLVFQTTSQMVINSPCLADKKELASPGQTETGKDFSNPLMDDLISSHGLYKNVDPHEFPHATAKVKKINDQEQIQALIDKKKVIITKDNIRSDLHFDDAEGTACYSMKQFLKACAHGRIGARFSRVITPLFDTMMVQAPAYMGDTPVETHQTPIVDQPSTSKPQKKQKPKRKQRNEAKGMTNDDEMFGVDDLAREEVFMDTTTGEHEEQIIKDVSTVEPVTTAGEVVTTTVKDSVAPTIDVTEDEITMAQALAALKSIKPKVVVQEQEMSTTILAAATTVTTAVPTPRAKCIVFHEQKQSQIHIVSSLKDKGKAMMIEPEIPIKKKDKMRIDEEYARRLEAEEQGAARLSRA
nr:hypothetical protein [Tanacetum cinerariifolium]